MLEVQDLTINGHEVFIDNYIVFPYPIKLKDIDPSGAILTTLLNKYSELPKELVEELADTPILKVPKIQVVNDFLEDLGDTLKAQITESQIINLIDKRKDSFLSNLFLVISPNMNRLFSRVIRLNKLIDLGAPDQVRIAEEKLCIKEAIFILAVIKTGCMDLDINECFKKEYEHNK